MSTQIFDPDHRAITVIEEGEGPLVVLLPGQGFTVASLGTVAHVLVEEGFRVLRIGSRRATADVTLHDLARDVVDVLDERIIQRAWIGGHGFGGAVARTVALDHPGRVEGLLLFGVRDDSPTDPEVLAALDRVFSASDADSAADALRLLVGPDVEADLAWQLLTRGRDVSIIPMQRSALAATPVDEWWPLAPRIPVGIVQGSADRLSPPAQGEALRLTAPERASIAVIDGGGAFFPLTHPGEIGEEIEDYLGWD